MRGLRPLHPIVSILSFLATMFLLPSCVQVGERLTGIGARPEQNVACLRDCTKAFNEDLAGAAADLQAALEACKGLPDGDRAACTQAASDAYAAKVEELNLARKACIEGCHDQGSGGAE